MNSRNRFFHLRCQQGYPLKLLDRRPDVLAAERRLEAQNARMGATEALQYPQLTIGGDLTLTYVDPTILFGTLSAQIFGPLFNSGENRKRLEVEIYRMEQFLMDYENTFLNALKEVEDAMIAVETFQREFDARLAQLEAASQALEMAWVRYNNGVTS